MKNKNKISLVATVMALSLAGCGTTRNCPSEPRIGKRIIAEVKKNECSYGDMMLGYCYDKYSSPIASLYSD